MRRLPALSALLLSRVEKNNIQRSVGNMHLTMTDLLNVFLPQRASK